MSPCPERHARRRRDDGFTLVEVIVALTIFMVVAAAAAPVLIGGLQAAATARDVTQSKGVAQGQLEKMRDLPFYVGRAAGDYLDVLDTYYRNMTAPAATPSCSSTPLAALPPTTWRGYVAASGSHCIWEPTGPLYRVVVNPVVADGLGVFSMVISTQFLTGGDSPVAVPPPTGYTSQTSGKDAPPSSQIGVTVAVLYKNADGVHYSATFSQIEQASPTTPRVTSEAKASTARIASALDADTTLLEQLGVINLSGELYTGSRVVTTAAAATAGDSLGQQINGARVNLVAPVDRPATSASATPMPASGGCNDQCFGSTLVDQASALSSNGLPRAGTSTAPVRAMIPHNAGSDGFRFSNGTGEARLQFKASEPMVSLDTSVSGSMAPISGCAVQPTGATASYLTGTGYLDATTNGVAACGTAQSKTIRLFPTTFADKGVINVTLDYATASCSVTKPGGGVASAAYQAKVSYWNGSGYTDVSTLRSTNTVDPLAGVNLGATVAPGLTLGDYVSAWRSTTASEVKRTTTTTTAQAAITTAVSILTKPTRGSDPTSIVSLDLGAVSCQVGDRR